MRITCPLPVVYLLSPDADYCGVDLAEIWSTWAAEVQTAQIDCGHHVAEERPDELADPLLAFLSR